MSWTVLTTDTTNNFDKKFDEGKRVILRIPEIDYVIVHWPNNVCTPWVAAWAYNEEGGYWGQGHYFTTSEGAIKYIREKLEENKFDVYGVLLKSIAESMAELAI